MRKKIAECVTIKTLIKVMLLVVSLLTFFTPVIGQQESGAIVEEAHLLIGGNIGNVYGGEIPPEYAYLIGTQDLWGEIYVTFNYEDSTSETLSVSIPWDWLPPSDWTGTYTYRKYVGRNPARCSWCPQVTMFDAVFTNPNPTKKVVSIKVSDDWVGVYPWSDVFALTLKSPNSLRLPDWYSDGSGYYFLEKDDTRYFSTGAGANSFPEYSIYNGIKFYTHGKNDLPVYGGMDLSFDKAVIIDIAPPTTTIALSGTLGNNDWYTSDVQVTLTATDNEGGSGVKNTEYSFDGTDWNLYTSPFTIKNEGANTVYYRSTDNAGNVEPVKTQQVKIDKTPPTITGVPLISKFSDGFNDNDISDWIQNANGDSGATADNGRMRLRVWKCFAVNVYKDLGFVSGQVTIDFDWQSQSEGWWENIGWKIVVDGVEVLNEGLPIRQYGGYSGHTTKTVNVNGNARLLFWEEGGRWCGNGDHYNTYLWVDNVVIKTAADADSWYNRDVLVRFTASDDVSGIDTVTPDTIISTEGASQSVTGTATDKAGNSASTTVSGINIDKTPPQVTINIPASGGVYLLNQALTADWSATDSLSGIASATGTLPSGAAIDTSMAGTKTFTVAAADIADNTATQTSSYTIAYNFLGILPPIREDGSSIFNSGSTVPVKFRIADANGNYMSTAIASLTYQKITDEILGTIEEAVSTSAANEGNTFRYDSTDNLYIFNLGTEGMNAGTYQLNINLDDGTTHTVRISLR